MCQGKQKKKKREGNQDDENFGSCIIWGIDDATCDCNLPVLQFGFNAKSYSELGGHVNSAPSPLTSWTEYIMSTLDFEEPFIVLNFKEQGCFLKMWTKRLK